MFSIPVPPAIQDCLIAGGQKKKFGYGPVGRFGPRRSGAHLRCGLLSSRFSVPPFTRACSKPSPPLGPRSSFWGGLFSTPTGLAPGLPAAQRLPLGIRACGTLARRRCSRRPPRWQGQYVLEYKTGQEKILQKYTNMSTIERAVEGGNTGKASGCYCQAGRAGPRGSRYNLHRHATR